MQCAVVTNKVFESLAQEKEWHFFVRLPSPQELGRSRYIFFPFWSHKVPKEITDKYECVCFHMTDVPYGRGGSPLQNLILRGHTETVISALRMTDEMDAGPVYMKRPLSLEGSAQEIYERAAGIISGMMREIAETEPTPVPQVGEVVEFKRRTPEMSEMPAGLPALATYDFIRMLDADGYPRAFILYENNFGGRTRVEFSNARLEDGKVIATAVIST
jgi:methionyl-tRNA formyltransferase